MEALEKGPLFSWCFYLLSLVIIFIYFLYFIIILFLKKNLAVAWSYINYVYAPQAMFVKIDPKIREENQELFDGSDNSFDFAERVYNPDLVKPLLKVWVSPEMKP